MTRAFEHPRGHPRAPATYNRAVVLPAPAGRALADADVSEVARSVAARPGAVGAVCGAVAGVGPVVRRRRGPLAGPGAAGRGAMTALPTPEEAGCARPGNFGAPFFLPDAL